jgi:serine/threonine protein kinase
MCKDEEERFYLMILEYCNSGDLASYIKSNGKLVNLGYGTLRILEESVARQFMRQILEAFAYMHALYDGEFVIHRDLKFENIFIHKEGE